MPPQTVSVVIPTRDRPELMRQAVSAAVAQDYEGHLEVVVVYDQSEPDSSVEELSGAHSNRVVRVARNSRTPGLAGGRNTGIDLATGEFIAFCDDDDYFLPSKIRTQAAVLASEPETSIVSNGIRVDYDGTSHVRMLDRSATTLDDLLRDRTTELHPSTFLMRRDDVREGFGLVNEQIPGSYAEDYEFLLRAAKFAPIRSVGEVLTVVQWHPTSYFVRKWETIVAALSWLLEAYPEFERVPKGSARVRGQIAFAEAAQGRRRQAASWAAAAALRNPLEPRWGLAVLVAAGVLNADHVVRRLNARGRGI